MWRIGLFICAALLSILFGFVIVTTDQSVWLVKTTGYWFMLVTFLSLFLAVLRVLWEQRELRANGPVSQHGFLRVSLIPAVFILIVSFALGCLQSGGYKIVMDEPVLASTSLRMHEHKEVMVTARAHVIEGEFTQLDGYVDKRPYFFPFLVSFVHDLIGYRSANSIWLNYFITPVLLGFLYYGGRCLGPPYGGYLAVSLAATLPLLAMNVNGGGFELLNLLMIFMTLFASGFYLKEPRESRMDLLILVAVLLAQTRYESAVYILAVGLVILIGWVRQKRLFFSVGLLMAPVLCLPIALQQKILSDYGEFWQLKDGVEAPFTLGVVPDNLMHAARFFFNWSDAEQPNSLLLSIVYTVALAGILIWVGRRRLNRPSGLDTPNIIAALVFGAVAVFNFCLLMAYHWGQLDDIIATRIVLPFIFFQILFVVFFVGQFRAKRTAMMMGLIGTWLYFAFFTIPANERSNFLARVPGWYQSMWLQSEVRQRAGQRVLYVSNRHLVAIGEKAAAIPEFHAKTRKSALNLHHQLGTYDEILFAHVLVRPPEGEFAPKTPIYDDFELAHISEQQIGRNMKMRMSRLVAVKWKDDEEQVDLMESLPSEENASERAKFLALELP